MHAKVRSTIGAMTYLVSSENTFKWAFIFGMAAGTAAPFNRLLLRNGHEVLLIYW
jgi:hypothetical protein